MNISELHDNAIQAIVKELFTFPGSQVAPGMFRETWVTYTNVPKRQMPVDHQFLGEIYPDIVIADTAKCNLPRLIAEVETEDTLTLEKAIQAKWSPDTTVCGIFYLFVPEGCARKAAAMILNYKICFPTALFTYAFDKGEQLRLTPV